MGLGDKKEISREDVESITGAPKSSLVNNFIQALSDKNIELGLKSIKEASGQNIDMKIYLKLILAKLRLALLLRYAPEMKKDIEEKLGGDDSNFLHEILKAKSDGISSKTLAVLLESYQELRYAFIPELPLELALIKLFNS